MNKLYTRVLCVELNKEFDSIKEAARYVGGDPSNLRSCLQGKYKTHCGYHWKTIEDVYDEPATKIDCFAYAGKSCESGHCRALTKLVCRKHECSFYKPKDQVPASVYAVLDLDEEDY